LTPILLLKNRHEKVQENRNAHKKGIRRATVNTFGYMAKAIGPQDVLNTLLNNLCNDGCEAHVTRSLW